MKSIGKALSAVIKKFSQLIKDVDQIKKNQESLLHATKADTKDLQMVEKPTYTMLTKK